MKAAKHERPLLTDTAPFVLRKVPLPVLGQDALAPIHAPPGIRAEESESEDLHYAWVELPFVLEQVSGLSSRNTGPSIHVDLCSAVPVYASLMECVNLRACLDGAEALLASIHATTQRATRKTVKTLDGSRYPYATVWDRILQDDAIRRLLTYSLCDIAYRLPIEVNFDVTYPGRLLSTLRRDAPSNSRGFDRAPFDPEDIESVWGIGIEVVELEATLRQRVGDLQIPMAEVELARRLLLLKGNADFSDLPDKTFEQLGVAGPAAAELVVAAVDGSNDHVELSELFDAGAILELLLERIALEARREGTLRPSVVFSVDIADASDLRSSAERSFEPPLLDTRLYARALDRLGSDLHLSQDVVGQPLPFAPGAVALITCFEGWPFYAEIPDSRSREYAVFLARAANFIGNLYLSLKPQGRIIFFPWDARDGRGSTRALGSHLLGILFQMWPPPRIESNLTTGSELAGLLGRFDRPLADRSPLFTDTERVMTALTIAKPSPRSAGDYGPPIHTTLISVSDQNVQTVVREAVRRRFGLHD